ncbi:MAG: hypothetical protein H6557_15865 [Lewinellaceae bacterium]|nr:hypothetical protein [Phaeodactylibacter sp.]MCB9038094.1 hypothetical protein [Lewinellaceae bacterium]
MELSKMDRTVLKEIIRELLLEDSIIFKKIIEEILEENKIIISGEQMKRRKLVEKMIQEDFDKYDEVFKELA